MTDKVSVNDPMYVVRRRLGKELERTENRNQTASVLEHIGQEMDMRIMEEIRADYEEEMSGMTPQMPGMQELEEEDISSEEAKRQVQKFMRVSSLQAAYRAYPVAKSIVMN